MIEQLDLFGYTFKIKPFDETRSCPARQGDSSEEKCNHADITEREIAKSAKMEDRVNCIYSVVSYSLPDKGGEGAADYVFRRGAKIHIRKFSSRSGAWENGSVEYWTTRGGREIGLAAAANRILNRCSPAR